MIYFYTRLREKLQTLYMQWIENLESNGRRKTLEDLLKDWRNIAQDHFQAILQIIIAAAQGQKCSFSLLYTFKSLTFKGISTDSNFSFLFPSTQVSVVTDPC